MNPFTKAHVLTKAAMAGLIAAALIVGPALAAEAAEDPSGGALQQEIDRILAENPGGIQTGPDTVSWQDGAVELTLPQAEGEAAAYSIGSCATGSYCAYSGTNRTGSKLAFWVCDTTVSTAAIGTVRSLANARTSGSVLGKNSSGGVLTSLAAGAVNNNAISGITQLTCT